jgi:plastocyanin|tara:strand:- start:1885 stop:2388 length:504 start_codon:yes stop_codon:yes gene_type:complete
MRVKLIALLLISVWAIPMASAENQTEDVIITVDSTNLRFSPSSVTVDEGDAVRFFWDGQILPHNAVEENGTFDSGDTTSNEDYRFVFLPGLNGTFEYYCEPHRSLGMVGEIIVNPVPVMEMNNTSEENATDTDMEEEEESFMPFLSMPSMFAAVAVAFISRKDELSE